MKALLVDDERLARQELRKLLAAGHPAVEVAGEAANVDEARQEIRRQRPNLIFLDIQMPGGSGFDLLAALDADAGGGVVPPRVVFVTAFDEHALRAFEFGAVDYLLKPIDPKRLAEALQRVGQSGKAPVAEAEHIPLAHERAGGWVGRSARSPRLGYRAARILSDMAALFPGAGQPDGRSVLKMVPRSVCQVLLAAFFFQRGAAMTLAAPADTASLDGAALMGLALQHDRAESRRRASWVCDREVVTVKTDAQGHSLDTRRESQNGVPLDAGRGASGQVDAIRAAGGQNSDGRFDIAVDLGRLAGRFDLKREADGASRDGRACYVVAFCPRAGALPVPASREEQVVSQLTGHFWLAKEDLAIVQSEGELARPVPVAWVASVDRLRFHYQSLHLADPEGTLPASFELEVSVSAPFYRAGQRQTTTIAHPRPSPSR